MKNINFEEYQRGSVSMSHKKQTNKQASPCKMYLFCINACLVIRNPGLEFLILGALMIKLQYHSQVPNKHLPTRLLIFRFFPGPRPYVKQFEALQLSQINMDLQNNNEKQQRTLRTIKGKLFIHINVPVRNVQIHNGKHLQVTGFHTTTYKTLLKSTANGNYKLTATYTTTLHGNCNTTDSTNRYRY